MKCLITLNDGTSESIDADGGEIHGHLHDLRQEGLLKSYRIVEPEEARLTMNVPPQRFTHDEMPLPLPTWNQEPADHEGLHTRQNAQQDSEEVKPLPLPTWDETPVDQFEGLNVRREQPQQNHQHTVAVGHRERPLSLPTW